MSRDTAEPHGLKGKCMLCKAVAKLKSSYLVWRAVTWCRGIYMVWEMYLVQRA